MNTHRRLRIATIFVLFTAYVLAGFQAAFSARRESMYRQRAAHLYKDPASSMSLLSDDSFAQFGLAPGRHAMLRMPISPHPVIGHAAIPVPPVTGGVQTYDVFAAPDSFAPPAGADGVTPLARAAVNIHPVWTRDERYILFASNRDADGTATTHPGRFHIWAVPATGNAAPIQITDSSAQPTDTNGTMHGELYPAVDPGNTELAFVSDARSGANAPNDHHLFVIVNFSPTPNQPVNLDPGAQLNAQVLSLTIRPDKVDPGFHDVARPTWGGSDRLAFAGLDDNGAGGGVASNKFPGHYHIWYLWVGSLGYSKDPTTNNLPAKLTDGPADDANPAWSGDGNFIAFDSNTAGLQSSGFAVAPGTSPINTLAPTGTNRQIYMISPGGTIPTSLQSLGGRLTSDSGDDCTPAWSNYAYNPYTNPTGNRQYVAFARGASVNAAHDIYYLSVLLTKNNSAGESPASNLAGTQITNIGTPLYQINAGGAAVAPYGADQFFNGGAPANVPGTVTTVNTAGEANPAPVGVFLNYRTGTAATPNFQYVLPNLVPGATYTLRLHFADERAGVQPGDSTFDIVANGTTLVSAFDIVAAAGTSAVERIFPGVQADANGKITVEFDTNAGAKQFATVSGVELISEGDGLALTGTTSTSNPAAPQNLTASSFAGGFNAIQLTWTGVTGATGYNIYRSNAPFNQQDAFLYKLNVQPTVIDANSNTVGYVDFNVQPNLPYYYLVVAVFPSSAVTTVTPESASNAVVHVVTETNGAAPGGTYNDLYPSWPAFASVYSLTYQSNRSVTYFDVTKTGPTSAGQPVETAISLPEGDAAHKIGANYVGVLVSQVLNLDPPTLLAFNNNEVLHVNQGNKLVLPSTNDPTGSFHRQLQPGTSYTFTVRLSDREAGIDDTGAVNGGANVYLQIKDPDSKYQDSQSLEHKVFAGDLSSPGYAPLNTSQTADALLFNMGGQYGWQHDDPNNTVYTIPGVVGGVDAPTKGTISVGIARGVNPNAKVATGFNPDTFYSWGPEYECQALNPTVLDPSTNAGDYSTPYYLAGIDDQVPFSGSYRRPRPTTGANAQWLQLSINKDGQGKVITDGDGGVLYSGVWTTPNSPSDFYLDVIAYDKAQFPIASLAGGVTNFVAKNWRIYDNVWGVSTANVSTSTGVLVVSDNALGQKWSATSFGGVLNRPENILPVYFGAESYVTDIDKAYLPNTGYYHYGGFPYLGAIRQGNGVGPFLYNGEDWVSMHCQARNGLGAFSYTDAFVIDGATTSDGVENYTSNQYSIWRTLCRGSLTSDTLKAWLPQPSVQPAVADGAVKVDAATVPAADRCVLWVSPYCGRLYTAVNNPGTLADPQQQSVLADFVNKGGRLGVTGIGVAANEPAFASSVLHGTLVNSNPADPNSRFLTATATKALTITDIASQWISNDFDFENTNLRTDGSLDQLGPIIYGLGDGFSSARQDILGMPDVIKPADATTKSEFDYNTGLGSGMVYSEAGTGSTTVAPGTRTVFASFGIEGISNDYYRHVDGTGTYNFHTETRNNRTMIVHGIVNYLRTGHIKGKIIDGNNPNTAIAGATVYAKPTDGTVHGLRAVYSATSDSGGNYDIAGIPPGQYDVIAYRSGYNRNINNFPTQIEGDVTASVTLKIFALNLAIIKGTVTDAVTKLPISGASVKWVPADSTLPTVTAVTNANGAYEADVASTAAGVDYTATASAIGYGQKTSTLNVVAGTTYTGQDFALTPQSAVVSGTITDKTTGKPISGATVVAEVGGTPVTGVPASITGADGTYSLALASGTYTIVATATNYAADSIDVTVGTTDIPNQDIQLTPAIGGTVGGLAYATTDGALGNITVTASGVGASTTTTFTTSQPAKPKGDGKPINWSMSLQPGTYTITFSGGWGPATKTGVVVNATAFTRVDQSFHTAQLIGLVKSTKNGTALQGGKVTIYDKNGVQIYTMQNGVSVPSITTTSATTSPGAPGGDGNPINYSATLFPDTYTVVFSKPGAADKTTTVTLAPDKATRVDGSFDAVFTYQAGLHFISLPYDYSALGWDGLFGAYDAKKTYRSRAAIWQQTIGQYVLEPNAPADTPHLGYGYWIRLYQPRDVSVVGAVPTTSTVAVPLTKGWNMIGVPNTVDVNVTSLTFVNPVAPATPLSWGDATGIQYNLVSPTLYSYNESTGAYDPVTTGGKLHPWTGYWIRANDNATLLLPTSGS